MELEWIMPSFYIIFVAVNASDIRQAHIYLKEMLKMHLFVYETRYDHFNYIWLVNLHHHRPNSHLCCSTRLWCKVKVPLYGCDCYAYALLASGFVDLVVESGLKVYNHIMDVHIVIWEMMFVLFYWWVEHGDSVFSSSWLIFKLGSFYQHLSLPA